MYFPSTRARAAQSFQPSLLSRRSQIQSIYPILPMVDWFFNSNRGIFLKKKLLSRIASLFRPLISWLRYCNSFPSTEKQHGSRSRRVGTKHLQESLCSLGYDQEFREHTTKHRSRRGAETLTAIPALQCNHTCRYSPPETELISLWYICHEKLVENFPMIHRLNIPIAPYANAARSSHVVPRKANDFIRLDAKRSRSNGDHFQQVKKVAAGELTRTSSVM